ncbi:MAG: DUF4160 domain-containing protein [Acidithiobacillus ferriphilus]|jgi:hypothetical protein|uniref:DUF4160 domain-containing protein n=1 Tax=Acidithiobacillus ferriphilus TaxID=1689834 RepID=UPI00242C8466|nr:DUF4160 domain-containing protein [Acidithiobacillus ferriphilus]MBW9250345.1 DUF4160 domain-containing protein [Acidithiobacillus ferriphilus]MBW9255778.1 DUF4160 domain-containing protein [Acidithiobacillus ferriphilus]
MPELSRFYGIVLAMFWRDHLPPHFHAYYAGQEAEIGLDGTLLAGSLPRRALQLVEDWRIKHLDELTANWEHASRKEPITPIEPLE